MKRELKLFWDDETGDISDNRGNRFDLAHISEAAQIEKQFHTKGRDVDGSVTITGNLTVQDSEWVYLRGPITGSGLLANGWVTASEVYIRKNDKGDGSLRLEGDLTLMGDGLHTDTMEVREILSTAQRLKEIPQKIEGMGSKVSHIENRLAVITKKVNEMNVEELSDGIRDLRSELESIRTRLTRFGVGDLERELKGIRDDLNIIMSILHR
jgi:archaellum component FlaC